MICFDTTPLIWGMQNIGESTKHTSNIERTKLYIKQLAEQKEQIIIPTPVLAEYLVKIPADNHAEVISQLRDVFLVYPFDERAASFAAALRTLPTFKQTVEQVVEESGLTYESARQIVKVDAMVIAIAVTRGAQILISEDKGMRNLALGKIEAFPVPHVDRQLEFREQMTEGDEPDSLMHE